MSNILLIGEQRSRALGIRSILRRDGHQVAWINRVPQWRHAEQEVQPELVVATADTVESVLRAAGKPQRGFPAPLLFVHDEAELIQTPHLDDRLTERIDSPFMSEEFLARVDALVRARMAIRRTAKSDAVCAEPAAAGFGQRIRSWLGTRVPRYERPLGPYLQVAARIAEWADRRDAFEPGHAGRVAGFSAMIAEALDLPDGESSALLRAAMLHDIGKVALPVEMLRQTDPLREEQKRLIRTHPERGADLLQVLDQSDASVADSIRYHHEQPDGDGYYRRPAAEIPRAAMVLGVAEAYDAMTTTRFGEPLGSKQAIRKLREYSGSKFDRDAVEALADTLDPRDGRIPLSV